MIASHQARLWYVAATAVLMASAASCSSSSPSLSGTSKTTVAAAPGTSGVSDPYSCHVQLTGSITKTLQDIGRPGTNNYWWKDGDGSVKPGEVDIRFGCAAVSFRTTHGTTMAQIPKGPGRYVIVDYTKDNVAGGDNGFFALDSGPGAFNVIVDSSVTLVGSDATKYAVSKPGSLDISSFDGKVMTGTYSFTLNAEPGGKPPLDATRSIDVHGTFSYTCSSLGDPSVTCA